MFGGLTPCLLLSPTTAFSIPITTKSYVEGENKQKCPRTKSVRHGAKRALGPDEATAPDAGEKGSVLLGGSVASSAPKLGLGNANQYNAMRYNATQQHALQYNTIPARVPLGPPGTKLLTAQ